MIKPLPPEEHRVVADLLRALETGLREPLLYYGFVKTCPLVKRGRTVSNTLGRLRYDLEKQYWTHWAGYSPYATGSPPAAILANAMPAPHMSPAEHLRELYKHLFQPARQRFDGRVPAAIRDLTARLDRQLVALIRDAADADRWRRKPHRSATTHATR